jgi:hypothetical protein
MTTEIVFLEIWDYQECRQPYLPVSHGYNTKPMPQIHPTDSFEHQTGRLLLLSLTHPLQTLHRILQLILKNDNMPRPRRT